ncbi:MAG: DNA topoisomerase I, partial [Anaerolinea sp.]|nr:DNA topoisomerase I [Anaerolinea sp.]
MTRLMIVESAAKAKKIAQFLGEGWRVEACLGHVRDLPVHTLGVDVARSFKPAYMIPSNRVNGVKRLTKAMRDAEA